MYAVKTKVNEIDEKLVNMNYLSIQYISFKKLTVSERIRVMHVNEIINVKARFETLLNVKMNKVMKYNDK